MRNIRFHVLIGVCAAASLMAQTDRGVITGTVKDVSGAVVPSAQVTAIQTGTNANFKTRTTTSGDFTVPSLPVGTYQVRVENTGFKTFLANNVVVAAGATVPLDVVMELGTTQQTVEVVANAQMLQTEAGRVATEVSSRLVDELPVVVNGAVRSPFDLSASAAEVNSTGQYRVGGGRGGAYGMTLDGTSVTTAGQLDSQRRHLDADQHPLGRRAHRIQRDLRRLQGRDGPRLRRHHEFRLQVRHQRVSRERLRVPAQPGSGRQGFLRRHQAGLQAERFRRHGGRPGVHSQALQRQRQDVLLRLLRGFPQPRRSQRQLPTAFRRRSSTPATCTTTWMPAARCTRSTIRPRQTFANGTYTRTPFPNNQIPQTRIDPVAKSIIRFVQPLLKPNVAGLVPGTSAYVRNNYTSAGSSISPNNKFSIKGDQVLTSKQRISFFFERTREQDLYGPTGAPGLPAPLSGSPGYNRSDVYRISHDYTISPTLAESLLRRRQQLGAEPRVVRHLQRLAAGSGTADRLHRLEREGDLHSQLSRLQPRFPAGQFFQQRVHQLGPARAERFGQHRRGIP